MKATRPLKKAGLVLFDNNTDIIGDAMHHIEKVAKKILNNEEQLKAHAEIVADMFISHTIDQSYDSLSLALKQV